MSYLPDDPHRTYNDYRLETLDDYEDVEFYERERMVRHAPGLWGSLPPHPLAGPNLKGSV